MEIRIEVEIKKGKLVSYFTTSFDDKVLQDGYKIETNLDTDKKLTVSTDLHDNACIKLTSYSIKCCTK